MIRHSAEYNTIHVHCECLSVLTSFTKPISWPSQLKKEIIYNFISARPSGHTRLPFRPSDAVSTSCSEGFDNVAFEGFPPTNSSHHATFCIPNMCLFLSSFEKCNQTKGVAKRTVRHQSVGRSRKENLSAFNCRNPTRQSRSFLMTRPTPSRAYPLWRPIKNSRVSKLNKFNSGSVKCRRSVA